jgi:hypothetical protein
MVLFKEPQILYLPWKDKNYLYPPTNSEVFHLLLQHVRIMAFPPNIEPTIPEPRYCTLYTGTKCPHNIWGPEAVVQLRWEKRNPDNS